MVGIFRVTRFTWANRFIRVTKVIRIIRVFVQGSLEPVLLNL